MRVCLDRDCGGEIELRSVGSADWHLTGWIGLPDTIPPLRGAAATPTEPTRRRAFFQTNGSGQGAVEIQGDAGEAVGGDCSVM